MSSGDPKPLTLNPNPRKKIQIVTLQLKSRPNNIADGFQNSGKALRARGTELTGLKLRADIFRKHFAADRPQRNILYLPQ